jgi:hypothetical protein
LNTPVGCTGGSRRLPRGFDVDVDVDVDLTPKGESDSIILIDTPCDGLSQIECYPTIRQRGVATIPEESEMDFIWRKTTT